jgi:perosamine synthetase
VHLRFARLGELAAKWDPANPPAMLSPVLDDRRRIVAVRVRPEAAFMPVSEPDLTHLELRNLLDAFLSTWISSIGDYVRGFEQAFARKVGMAHGVATSNGSVSLQLGLAALGIGEGDEVIVPDLTFAASANSVIHVGARPVLVDVDRDTWCVSVEAIEKAITPRTRAVMPVHVFGRPAPMTEIAALAKARGIFVMEDCAEAHGARYDGRPVGSFSDVASFSFYGNKIITTGEGGICLTDDPKLAARMRMLRDHGMRPDRRYWHEEPGFNFRMTNLQAAIGCAQLERMDELIDMRRGVHAAFEAAFAGVPGVALPPPMPARCEPVVWFSCLLTPAEKRPALIAACKEVNIDLRPFFHGLSSMPAYREFSRPCPVSAALSSSGVNLPTFRKVDARIAGKIADIFRRVLASP